MNLKSIGFKIKEIWSKWAPLIVLIGLLSAFIAIALFPSFFNKPVIPIQPDRKEVLLTKWVYEHSTKISRRQANEIVKEAMKTSKPLLMLATFSVESEFNPTATSTANAKGLGQVMWKYWGEDLKKAGICVEERDLYEIDTGVKSSAFVMDKLLKDSKGDIASALTKYLGANNTYYKNRITETLTNLYILTQGV